MKYLIIEDEPLAAEKLRESLTELRPGWEFLGTISSVEKARQELTQSEAELIFVDIHLGDGLSFEIFKHLNIEVPLIFTTAYDQYALRAFELNSIDYLLKPIRKDDLERALNKLNFRANPPAWEKLLRDLKPKFRERFLVSTGERIKTVKCTEIAHFFAQGKNCFLTDAGGRQYLLDQSLSQLMGDLDPKKFFQINRQLILNLDYIQEMIPRSKSRLKVQMEPPTPEEAVVSVERSPQFKRWVAGED